jgi:nitrile hydratase subunit beta
MTTPSAETPRFRPGDRVRVADRTPEGHCRTPGFLRGKIGRVERVLGHYRNPEQLAYYRPADTLPLYYVLFRRADLWPGCPPETRDTVAADIYEHWLEPAEESRHA